MNITLHETTSPRYELLLEDLTADQLNWLADILGPVGSGPDQVGYDIYMAIRDLQEGLS